MGLEELTNIRNVERLKKELRVRLQYMIVGKLGYLVTDVWTQCPAAPGAARLSGCLTLELDPAGPVF